MQEMLHREKMRDVNARVCFLVKPMSLHSVLRSSVRARGPCNGRLLRAVGAYNVIGRKFSNLAMGVVQLRAGIAPLEAPKRIVVRSVAADVD